MQHPSWGSLRPCLLPRDHHAVSRYFWMLFIGDAPAHQSTAIANTRRVALASLTLFSLSLELDYIDAILIPILLILVYAHYAVLIKFIFKLESADGKLLPTPMNIYDIRGSKHFESLH